MDEQTRKRYKEYHARSRARLARLPNVVGTMVSTKITVGQDTGKPCITVLVRKKLPKELLKASEIVPPVVVDSVTGEEFLTDVVESGEIRKQVDKKSRLRPALRGCSLGHYQITAGTFGCVVYRGSDVFILSNNHVLANENRAALGDPVVQPGPYDGGRVPDDVIGYLEDFVPVRFPQSPSDCNWARAWVALGNGIGTAFGRKTRILPPVSIEEVTNTVDCAIARPKNVSDVSNEAFEGGRFPAGTIEANVGLEVFKTGRTTCLTTGRIIGIDATVSVGYGQGTATFEGQIVSGPMSQGGDSGSILQEVGTDRVVGLLFAGSFATTICNPIDLVLRTLRVSLV